MAEQSAMNIFKKAQENVQTDAKDENWVMDTEAIMGELRQAAVEILQEQNPEAVEVIEELKKKHKDLYLYFFSEDEFYVYRPVTRLEYKDLSTKYTNSDELAEQIVLNAVLYPKLKLDNLSDLKAGVVPTLLELILTVSNFGVNNPVIKL